MEIVLIKTVTFYTIFPQHLNRVDKMKNAIAFCEVQIEIYKLETDRKKIQNCEISRNYFFHWDIFSL